MSTDDIRTTHKQKLLTFQKHIEESLRICSRQHDNCRDCEKIGICVNLTDKIIDPDNDENYRDMEIAEQIRILAEFKKAGIDIDIPSWLPQWFSF